jgi:hypothetical protein
MKNRSFLGLKTQYTSQNFIFHQILSKSGSSSETDDVPEVSEPLGESWYIQNIYFDFRSLCLLPRLGAFTAGRCARSARKAQLARKLGKSECVS